jgi:hypothetical protein
LAVDGEEGEHGVEGFGHHDGPEDYEEGAGEDLEVDELSGGAETGVQSTDVGLVSQGEVAFYAS